MDDVSKPNVRITEFLGRLQRLSRARYEGVVFEDQDVFLDGRDFINCTFRRCRLRIVLGAFMFSGTQNLSECSWLLGGPADSTVKLIQYVQSGGDLGHGPIQ